MRDCQSSLASRLAALDKAFFATALDAPVTRVRCQPLAFAGAAADMARFHLQYAQANAGPASVVGKIRGASPQRQAMEAARHLYSREARLYRDFAGHLPINTPRCYFIGDGDSTPLLLEDLGDLRCGDQASGLSVEDAETLMDNLAALHARFWESNEAKQDWLADPATGAFAGMICQLVASGVDGFREAYTNRVDSALLDVVAALAPRWQDVLSRGAEGPQTLIHGDCRLDNIFFNKDGAPIFVDWQLPARSRGTADVGNLLAGSMNIDLLNTHWEDLLRRYHDGLLNTGVQDYSWQQCREHYRQSILYPLGAGIALMGNLAMDDSRGVRDAMVLRPLLHCAALDSFNGI